MGETCWQVVRLTHHFLAGVRGVIGWVELAACCFLLVNAIIHGEGSWVFVSQNMYLLSTD